MIENLDGTNAGAEVSALSRQFEDVISRQPKGVPIEVLVAALEWSLAQVLARIAIRLNSPIDPLIEDAAVEIHHMTHISHERMTAN